MPSPTPELINFLSFAIPGVLGAVAYLTQFRRAGRKSKDYAAIFFAAIFYVRFPIAILKDLFVWSFASPLVFGEWGRGVSFYSSCIVAALLGVVIGRWMRREHAKRHPNAWRNTKPDATA